MKKMWMGGGGFRHHRNGLEGAKALTVEKIFKIVKRCGMGKEVFRVGRIYIYIAAGML